MFLIRTIITCRRVLFNLQLYVSYCLFIISFYNEIGSCRGQNGFDDYLPNSNLCRGEEATCSHQVALFNLSEGACTMFYRNSTSEMCSDESFSGDVDIDYSLGEFSLLTYLYKEKSIHRIPAFNLTFSSIKWTSMKMRFKQNDSPDTSICREFRLSGDIPPEFLFYFDCLWNDSSEGSYEGKYYQFQYQVLTPSSHSYLYKYFFKVPPRDNIDEDRTSVDKWEVFSVVDMTDRASRLVLTGQTAPASFNVSGYRVQLISKLWDNTRVVVEKVVTPSKDSAWFKFKYETRSRPGIYHFTVRLVHPDCEGNDDCHVTITPSIEIAALPDRMTLILFVGAVILIPLCIMAYFIWRRKCYTNVPSTEPAGPPKFLLIYNPVSVEHVRSMIEVAKYFNKVCHLQAMIDVLGIPQSEHKDPLKWYIVAFNEADFVGIFPSPKCSSSTKDTVFKSSPIVYNTEGIAQSQLRQRLCSPGAKCKFFGVALPGTCWDTLPDEAQALKRYTLPRDLDPLLVLIGVVPQCDQGKGFMEALALAHPERETLVLTLNGGVNSSSGAGAGTAAATTSAASTPTPTPVTCCAALSTSEPDLLSTSQQVTSCMTTPASSDDQLSLLDYYDTIA